MESSLAPSINRVARSLSLTENTSSTISVMLVADDSTAAVSG
jgi:hypothetical protein